MTSRHVLPTSLAGVLLALGLVACGGDGDTSAPTAVGGAAPAVAPVGAARTARNVVVLTLDTLRSDALGCYGAEGGHTPRLDALASRGVVFEHSYAPIATTFPSHASMFTGVYPRAHGVRWNGQTLDEEWDTLAEVLADDGFETGAFVSYKAMVNRGGLGQGFDAVSDPVQEPWDGARPGEQTVAMAKDWLDGRGDEPFFLWVHLFDPHSPYVVTDYAAAAMEGYSGPFADGCTAEEFGDLERGWSDDPVERDALRALYDGQVRITDRCVGDLLDHLDALGFADDTLVVAVGDHGQLLGEHGQVGHGPVLHEEVLRTPLMIAGPGVPAGRRVRDRVGVIDLMPTVLDLVDVAPPGELHGRSLAALAASGRDDAPTPYFAEVRVTGVSAPGPVEAVDDPVAVLQGPFKLVMSTKHAWLYDLRADPTESNRIDPSSRPEVSEDLLVLARRHQLMEPGQQVAHASEQLDEETLAELRALGYLK